MPQSVSTTTIRPDGRVTRTSSAMAAAGSARCWKTRSAPRAVDARVVEVEVGGITESELDRRVLASGSLPGDVEHRGTRVETDDRAGRPDGDGKGARRIAGAAADVDQPMAEPRRKQLGRGRPQPLHGRECGDLVQRSNQFGGARRGVDRGRSR